MQRRIFISTVGTGVIGASLSGCAGFSDGNKGGRYPGGTLVLSNTGDSAVSVSVTVKPAEYNVSLDTTVEGGEALVRRKFVTADPGDIVNLAARLGNTGEPISFRFLPAGGGDDATPEVARLTFENEVEAEASWTATPGE